MNTESDTKYFAASNEISLAYIYLKLVGGMQFYTCQFQKTKLI